MSRQIPKSQPPFPDEVEAQEPRQDEIGESAAEAADGERDRVEPSARHCATQMREMISLMGMQNSAEASWARPHARMRSAVRFIAG